MSVQSSPVEVAPGAPDDSSRLPAGRGPARRAWSAAAMATPFVIFCVLCFFASRTAVSDSDAANNALQGFDLLHGHLLLGGWIIGDATYYTFELPLYAIIEGVVGFHPIVTHIESAVAYTIVAILAAAIAKNRTKGVEAAVRIGVVLAVLTASLDTGITSPIASGPGIYGPVLLLGEPNHTTTCAFLLAVILLLQRGMARRSTPWILLAILTLGQLSDETVRIVFAGSLLIVLAWRMLAARSVRNQDGLLALMTVASVPLSMLIRLAVRALGGFTMVSPATQIAPVGVWLHHVKLIVYSVPQLFGDVYTPHATLVQHLCLLLSLAAMAVVGVAFLQGALPWFSSERSDQLLIISIVAYLGANVFYNPILVGQLHEISGVLPLMAALAGRRFPTRLATFKTAVPIIAVAALFPLVACVATRPVPPSPPAQLASWLEAHHQTYGIAGYWESSSVAMVSSNQVQVRAVISSTTGNEFAAYNWETKASWYDPKSHDATFFITRFWPTDPGAPSNLTPTFVEGILGKPTMEAKVGTYVILVYSYNLLDKVQPAVPASS
jgi:hypothetical protein